MRKTKKYIKKKPDRSQHWVPKILKVFSDSGNRPLSYKQVAAQLKITKTKKKDDLVKIIAKLVQEKRLKEELPGKFTFVPNNDFMLGTIDMTASGSAYVMVDELEQDIYISRSKTSNALNGDKVQVFILKKNKNKKLEGEIVEVVERSKSQFVGIYQQNKGFGFVVTDDMKMNRDIFIGEDQASTVEDGYKVVVKIIKWAKDAKNPSGKILKVLGKPGEHDVEIHSILEEYGLPYEFPEEIEQVAEQISFDIPAEEIEKRRDMRKVPTLTIDPADAKDFDDALSFQILENGNYEIGIHIADVSHYVKEGSALDKEAYERATSVYLVDRVVPMLPEKLSNGVCSLRPYEEKLCFSAVFELDEHAQIKNQWFGRTVIYSDHRFTYEDAQEIIEGAEGSFKDEVLKLNELAKILRKERLDNGAIMFDRAEVRFKLDENSEPEGIYFKISKEANHLIEEFMLLANKKVSEFVSLNKQKKESGKTFIFRIHDNPDPTKLTSIKNFVKQFGYNISIKSKKSTTQSLNTLLKNVKGKGEASMIETLVLRSMSKATYSTQNIGHYGLNFEHYSHFTSPIRRYPDVIAHRLLQHYLDGKSSPVADAVEIDCKHSAQRELLASDAERQSIKYMQAKYMQKFVGESFEGLITGVTDWGIYVEVIATKCEGMVRLTAMKEDHFIFDEANYCVQGMYSGKKYHIGDSVNITVASVDLKKKQIDFDWVPPVVENLKK